MIVKMKFLSISGPKNDIDRVCEVYLSKYEMQLENAAAELKTTDNLQPFVEVNPYKEPLAKAEQFNALLSDEDQRIDAVMNQDDMLSLIRDVNHDYLDLVEKKELTKKQVDEYKEKLLIMEPFRTLELDMQKSLKYKYMKVRFGRVDVNYYKRLEKYLFDDLNAVFIEGIRNENYVYGCYFVSNADSSKVDSVFNSLHFERIAIPSEYIGTPEQACEELEKAIEEKQKEIAEIEKQIRELMAKNAAKLRGAKRRLEELSTNFDVRKLAARIEEGDNKEDYYILCGWMGEEDVKKFLAESKNDDKVFVVVEEDKEKFFGEPPTKLKNPRFFKPFEMFIRMYFAGCIAVDFLHIEVGIRSHEIKHIVFAVAEPVFPAFVPAFNQYCIESVSGCKVNVTFHVGCVGRMFAVRFCFGVIRFTEFYAGQFVGVSP